MRASLLNRFMADRSGSTAIEYGVIAALISVVIMASAQDVGNMLGVQWAKIADRLAASTSR